MTLLFYSHTWITSLCFETNDLFPIKQHLTLGRTRYIILKLAEEKNTQGFSHAIMSLPRPCWEHIALWDCFKMLTDVSHMVKLQQNLEVMGWHGAKRSTIPNWIWADDCFFPNLEIWTPLTWLIASPTSVNRYRVQMGSPFFFYYGYMKFELNNPSDLFWRASLFFLLFIYYLVFGILWRKVKHSIIDSTWSHNVS